MYELLRPDDVKVVVDRQGALITIRGTAEEVQTVERFIDLITHSHIGNHLQWPVHSGVQRRYKLTKSKLRTLADALSFSDVYMDMPSRTELIIITAESDHEIIEAMVRILGGQRSHYD